MAPAMKTYTKAVRRSKYDKAVKYVNEVPRQPEIPKGLLRDVKQDSYPDICALSEKQAKMRIEVALKLRSPLWGRKCYACKFALVGKKLVGAKWFGKRCSNPKCQKMFKRIHIMYTPLYLKADNNQSKHPYKEFLHAMYIFGLKVPQDSMAHLIGKKRKNVGKWCSKFRVATAFAELQMGRSTQFPDGTLEFDCTSTAIKRAKKYEKGPKKNTHKGRFIIILHRETGQYCLEPLEDKDVKKGPAMESYEEIRKPILKKAHGGHVAASDSSPAFKKLAKDDLAKKGIPHCTVVHAKDEYATVVRFPMKQLSARLRSRVATLPGTTPSLYRMKAGENWSEGRFGVIKRNIYRMNLHKTKTTNASLNFLSAAWLARIF
jgi:hypothetical protein